MLDKRIAVIEAKLDIAELLTRYSVAVDDRDMAALADCFTEDGQLVGKDGRDPGIGRDNVMARYKSRFKALGPTCHWTHNHIITVDDDLDKASGLVLSHAEIWRSGKAYVAALRYEDLYRREGGKWRIASRTTSFFYYMPVTEYAEGLGDPLRMRAYGDRRPANFPEPLATWKSWEHW
ncbi:MULTISPECIES: nuclear transport factor 2 family protein [unclassified Chelatococcus]|uniref:nuclear transport factor 2 family protein n=1 Tax=unclassified Chelatococcus TaxID=2638111 RepID=UPI001BCB7BA6|nr:nuclear transport factor 2 family protein [Chelatococcus sp.]MBS7700256.1 nuclear transport factor 2 family protein [Chelatococcus sp. YT9]MBX3558227.1 nuclear transport factor 2 family protein [Chelatococcus sp.]